MKSENATCPPLAPASCDKSNINVWANCLISLYGIFTSNGAKKTLIASQPIAPANCPCKNCVNEQICLAKTDALFAGFEFDGIVGMFLIPFFFTYSGECPEQ